MDTGINFHMRNDCKNDNNDITIYVKYWLNGNPSGWTFPGAPMIFVNDQV